MSDDGKIMRLSFDDGTTAHISWPDTITLENLEMLEEVIRLQLRSVRKAIERRKAAPGKSTGEPIQEVKE